MSQPPLTTQTDHTRRQLRGRPDRFPTSLDCADAEPVLHAAVVFGKKPRRGETLHPHFERNLERALELADEGGVDLLVISGGPTRSGRRSEAAVAADLVADACPIPVVLECEARTTSENVRFVRDLLAGTPVDHLTIVTSAYHARRSRYFVARHWAEMAPMTRYTSGRDTGSLAEAALNWVYLAWAHVDPGERTLVRVTRRLLRNGGGG